MARHKILEEASIELREILVSNARLRKTVTYSSLARLVKTVSVEPHSELLNSMLVNVTLNEHRAKRPLLTSIVVRQEGEPGKGYFKLATRLGYRIGDPTIFWVEQVNKVFEFHSNRKTRRDVGPAWVYEPPSDDFRVEELLKFFDF